MLLMWLFRILSHLQKASDIASHDILLAKLELYGVDELVAIFFKNRKQYVHVSCPFLDLKYVLCGVPQRSTRGPLLFNLYIKDLQSVFSKSIIHYFADDTNLLFPNKNLEPLNL